MTTRWLAGETVPDARLAPQRVHSTPWAATTALAGTVQLSWDRSIHRGQQGRTGEGGGQVTPKQKSVTANFTATEKVTVRIVVTTAREW